MRTPYVEDGRWSAVLGLPAPPRAAAIQAHRARANECLMIPVPLWPRGYRDSFGRCGRAGVDKTAIKRCRSNVVPVIPLPRAWLLTSAMLVGVASGQVVAIATKLFVTTHMRPDVVIALVVGIPSALGVLAILCSTRRWASALGAFLLAVSPGWFGVLVLLQVVYGA